MGDIAKLAATLWITLKAYWGWVAGLGAFLLGAAAFASYLSTARKNAAELERLRAEQAQKESRIIQPTRDEMRRFGGLPVLVLGIWSLVREMAKATVIAPPAKRGATERHVPAEVRAEGLATITDRLRYLAHVLSLDPANAQPDVFAINCVLGDVKEWARHLLPDEQREVRRLTDAFVDIERWRRAEGPSPELAAKRTELLLRIRTYEEVLRTRPQLTDTE